MSEQLLEMARGRGYLTYGDILEAYPQPELQVAEVDQLYATLQREGIKVVIAGQPNAGKSSLLEARNGLLETIRTTSTPPSRLRRRQHP